MHPRSRIEYPPSTLRQVTGVPGPRFVRVEGCIRSDGAVGSDAPWFVLPVLLVCLVACDSRTPDAGAVQEPAAIAAPAVPESLRVPDGQRVSSHIYVQGVRIFVWRADPANPGQGGWEYVATQGALFNCDGKLIGYHSAGPTWESKATGREVRGVVLAETTCDVDAMPWSLIRATNAPAPGFARTTYIVRVNTTGGLAPEGRGDYEGQRVRVSFEAEDYFYRDAGGGRKTQ
jgi:hypothetical protein